ncbi:PREDICTED: protein FAM185A-like [Nicrophorus vespilloides]|uniref:Protein FAM185A-like n=1 Tax=Nicrophorus vespilloides TaxID=110193 RepID=A0ABM1M7I5_NICVS|nr:PREDICTED: protein FAM185A-like [Nicrophorus vespilloides]
MLKIVRPLVYLATRTYCKNPAQLKYTVSPTCHLNVTLPYKTVVKPLDPLDHPNNDKVIINCPDHKDIIVNQIDTTINIQNQSSEFKNNVLCEIIAPITANLNITTVGDLTVGNFCGDAMRLFSDKGHVTIGKSKNEYITAKTNDGNIVTDGDVQAAKVVLKSTKGDIVTNKLKCLGLHLESNSGKIVTSSSYCDESYFVTKTGTLDLQNVHKNSKILMGDNGILNMVGFDGVLDVAMQKGSANIHISRLDKNSRIVIHEEGTMTLCVSEELLQSTCIEISSRCCEVQEGIEHHEDEETGFISIKPKGDKLENVKLVVTCPKSLVNVKVANWSEMMQKIIQNKAQIN